MPERGRRKARETEAAEIRKPSQEPRAKAGKPAGSDEGAQPANAEGGPPAKQSVATKKAKNQADSPRVVHQDGVAYLAGCDVPIWRLEMARRAGSGPPKR